MKKQLFIRGDLNSLKNGTIPLRNPIWIEMLKREYGKIYDGMDIWLYEETRRGGVIDPTIFPGVIRKTDVNDEFDIVISENRMKYLSESKEFKNYSVDDVINDIYFRKTLDDMGINND